MATRDVADFVREKKNHPRWRLVILGKHNTWPLRNLIIPPLRQDDLADVAPANPRLVQSVIHRLHWILGLRHCAQKNRQAPKKAVPRSPTSGAVTPSLG